MLDLGHELVLRAGHYCARLSAAGGARLTSLTWSGSGRPVDLLIPWQGQARFNQHDWPKAGAFAMLPYSNRLAAGRFDWHGRPVQLATAVGADHALHGFGHRKAWQVMDVSAYQATLAYRHAPGDQGWPWPFQAALRFALDAHGIEVAITLTNIADQVAPASLGWHPFHPLPDGNCGLRLHARAMHDVGSDGLKRIRPGTAGGALREMPDWPAMPAPQTTAFEDWAGAYSLQLDPATRLVARADGCPHLVVHVPPRQSHICIEPVSLLPGALHHNDMQALAAGAALDPGATRRITWHCGVAT